jgi:hypothetical protein
MQNDVTSRHYGTHTRGACPRNDTWSGRLTSLPLLGRRVERLRTPAFFYSTSENLSAVAVAVPTPERSRSPQERSALDLATDYLHVRNHLRAIVVCDFFISSTAYNHIASPDRGALALNAAFATTTRIELLDPQRGSDQCQLALRMPRYGRRLTGRIRKIGRIIPFPQ